MKILDGIRTGYRDLKKKSLREKFRYIVSLNDEVHYLAFSFAIGVFIGLTPLYGLHTLLAVLAVLIFRLNLPATMIGAWLNFPLIAPGVYFLCYQIGRFVAIDRRTVETALLKDTIDRFVHLDFSGIPLDSHDAFLMIRNLTIGCTVAGIVMSVLSFILIRKTILIYRSRQHREQPDEC